MKRTSFDKKYQIIDHLKTLPRKMLRLHGEPNVTEFVLHELCNKNCFDIPRAAYFVDNPDFNCLKGIAGFCQKESYDCEKDIWSAQDEFSKHMLGAAFNQQVRGFVKESLVKKGENDDQIVHEIAYDFGLENPGYLAWEMKHGNHGLFLFEKHDMDDDSRECLGDGLCLLGFCPVF